MKLDNELSQYLAGLSAQLDPCVRFETAMGFKPREFQAKLMTSTAARVIALSSRQLGKSTSIACIAWDAFLRGQVVVAITPTEKQAKEWLLRVRDFRDVDPFAPAGLVFNKFEVGAEYHAGRILAMPATESARGFTADLLLLDECADLTDDDVAAVMPLRRKPGGRLLVTSTPKFKLGSFYEWWTKPNTFQKVLGHYRDYAHEPGLLDAIEEERAIMSPQRFGREYECQFTGSGEPLISHDLLERSMSQGGALCLA